ncbi:MAG: hypothetical protein U5J98_01325 [Halobacteriales archaeon]|nr:hypothetical protein [Halobacteriales archaeon]
MSAAVSAPGRRWNVGTSSLTDSALECEPSSERIVGGVSGSRNSLFGTVREWALAT